MPGISFWHGFLFGCMRKLILRKWEQKRRKALAWWFIGKAGGDFDLGVVEGEKTMRKFLKGLSNERDSGRWRQNN